MRISNERRRDTEQRVRAAARTLLAGEIPVGGKCDITTLARQAWISRATLYRSYPHLKAEFEDQLAQRQASGCAPDPRDTQVLRLQDENARLKDRLAAHESALAQLGEFKILALSRLAASTRKSGACAQATPPPPRRAGLSSTYPPAARAGMPVRAAEGEPPRRRYPARHREPSPSM